jgi:HEAT repeat protein
VTASASSWKAAKIALGDTDPIVRVNAAGALARLGSADANRRLATLLGDADPWMRRTAAHAIGRSGANGGVELLMKALEDPDEKTRGLAAWSLGQYGADAVKAMPVLEARLKTEEGTSIDYDIRDALASIQEASGGK